MGQKRRKTRNQEEGRGRMSRRQSGRTSHPCSFSISLSLRRRQRALGGQGRPEAGSAAAPARHPVRHASQQICAVLLHLPLYVAHCSAYTRCSPPSLPLLCRPLPPELHRVPGRVRHRGPLVLRLPAALHVRGWNRGSGMSRWVDGNKNSYLGQRRRSTEPVLCTVIHLDRRLRDHLDNVLASWDPTCHPFRYC